jgi:outer membrane protein assembly factor BamB
VSLRPLLLAGVAVALSACSTVSNTLDAINPFSKSAPKIQPAPLPNIVPTVDLARLWQAAIGASGEYVFTPAVVGERVFVAARDGALARFENGRQIWRIQAGQALSGGVGANDTLVVVGTAKGEVLAFAAEDGRALWQARASSEILSAPAVRGDLVAVRSGDARIFGFDAADGKRRWVYQRSIPALALRSAVGVTLTERALYAGYPGGKLVAVALNNGAALWESTVALPRGTTELERIADVSSDPVVEGSMVCAVAYQGRVACFDTDNGRQLWARELSSIAGLAIGPRAVVVTDEKSTVHAFERSSGAPLWKQDKLANRGLTRPLAVASRLAIADFEGHVHLLAEEDGAFLARQATDASAISAAPQGLPQSGDAWVVQTRNGAVVAQQIK